MIEKKPFPSVFPQPDFTNLGLGVGLRHTHFSEILETQPTVDWFEIISENFMDDQGWSRHVLREVAQQYPIVMHGVSLSIGSDDPLNLDYLKRLNLLAKEVNPKWISDHLCWTGVHDQNSHDLLPMPLTEESLQHVIKRLIQAQDILQRPLILENPSSYLCFAQSTFKEWEFLNILCNETDCGLLLDVNNVYVSARNHGFDPVDYINNLQSDRIVQIHLAGHTDKGDHCIDTHDQAVSPPVWSLYAQTQRQTGGVSTLLEWDANIPPLADLLLELEKTKMATEQLVDINSTTQPSLSTEQSNASNPIDFLMGSTP